MKYIIYENTKYDLLKPFSLNHPSFELRLGAFTNLERFLLINDFEIDSLVNQDKIILAVRNEIKDFVCDKYPNYSVISINDINNYSDYKKISCSDLNNSISNKINYLWDVFKYVGEQIKNDFSLFERYNNTINSLNAIKLNDKKIFTGENVIIKPGVILDASKGPIIIDENVIVGSNSVLEGPLYIGKNSEVSPMALIRGNTSIGPFCKIGGEVVCSVFQGYSNKVHHGFIGHSYIGEWVNIGAGTNNSNLKNNYGQVKIFFDTKIINTQLQFMGALIGDYTRIAIGTNLNTGIYIPIGANIFDYTFKQKKINPFSWGKNQIVSFNKFLETIESMKQRRNKIVTESEKKYLKYLYLNLKSI